MSFEAMAWAVRQKLPVKQKIVLLMLADRVNKDTGRCDPSIPRLAEDCGMSETSVKEAIRALREAGTVVAHSRVLEGVNLPNQYELIIDEIPGVGRIAPGGGSPRAPGVGRIAPPNLEEEPVREPELCVDGESDLFSADETPQQDRTSEGFERFWKVYPKKAGKPAALKAWQKAMRAGADPDAVVDAAVRYAQSDAVQRGFCKHPQGWLNDQRWLDDDLPQAPKTLTLEERARRLGPQWGEVVR